MGKGSTRRPSSVPPAVEADNWARTFGGKPANGVREVEGWADQHPEQAARFAVQFNTGAQWVRKSAETLADLKDGMRPFDSEAQS